MMRGSFDLQLVYNGTALIVALGYLPNAQLVSLSYTGCDRYGEPLGLAALLTSLVEKALDCADSLIAMLPSRFDEELTIPIAQRKPCRLEVIEAAGVNDIVRWLEILAAADVNRSERRQHEWNDI
jgi:hypothetical protein